MGTSLDITNSLGIELQGRYDFVIGDMENIDNNKGDMDLNGFSGQFSVKYQF